METLDKNNLNKHENKTVIEYCEDIINAQYYDLSKLKELNVIKAGILTVSSKHIPLTEN